MLKVTIITSTYNSINTIEDTLISVQNQDYKNIEHIIIDGLSYDGTIKKVEQYSHVAKVISEKDNGIYDAMNKGIDLATGDIIGILNSDDFYTSNEIISQVVNAFLSNETLECLYADLEYVDKNNTDKVVRVWKSGVHNSNSFLYGWMPPHPTFFVKKPIYEKYGKFNLTLKSSADYELMLRLLYKYKCKCHYLPLSIIKMRTGGASNKNILARISANIQDKEAWKINNLKPYFFTTWLKPIRKISQYI